MGDGDETSDAWDIMAAVRNLASNFLNRCLTIEFDEYPGSFRSQ